MTKRQLLLRRVSFDPEQGTTRTDADDLGRQTLRTCGRALRLAVVQAGVELRIIARPYRGELASERSALTTATERQTGAADVRAAAH